MLKKERSRESDRENSMQGIVSRFDHLKQKVELSSASAFLS